MTENQFAGCLVGVGLGDALAFPIEFLHMVQIQEARLRFMG